MLLILLILNVFLVLICFVLFFFFFYVENWTVKILHILGRKMHLRCNKRLWSVIAADFKVIWKRQIFNYINYIIFTMDRPAFMNNIIIIYCVYLWYLATTIFLNWFYYNILTLYQYIILYDVCSLRPL